MNFFPVDLMVAKVSQVPAESGLNVSTLRVPRLTMRPPIGRQDDLSTVRIGKSGGELGVLVLRWVRAVQQSIGGFDVAFYPDPRSHSFFVVSYGGHDISSTYVMEGDYQKVRLNWSHRE
jgi:hypothetical protein